MLLSRTFMQWSNFIICTNFNVVFNSIYIIVFFNFVKYSAEQKQYLINELIKIINKNWRADCKINYLLSVAQNSSCVPVENSSIGLEVVFFQVWAYISLDKYLLISITLRSFKQILKETVLWSMTLPVFQVEKIYPTLCHISQVW